MADELAEKEVRRPEGPLQQERPELTDDDGADEQRDDQDGHHGTAAAEGLDHRERQQEPEHELERHVDRAEPQGRDGRSDRHWIGDDAHKIAEPHEGMTGDGKIIVDEGDP